MGPNCVGIASHANQLNAAFAEIPPLAATTPALDSSSIGDAPPRIALVSQSGALALSLSQAAHRGVALAHVLTCGNSADVDVAHYLTWLAAQPDCQAVALTYEGLNDPEQLPAAMDAVVKSGKRLAVCKVGHSQAGHVAVQFHTATNPVRPPSQAAFFRSPGIVEVTQIESLLDTASFLAKAPVPRALGVAVLSGSGGTGILAVDAATRAGVQVPQPGEITQMRLRKCLPSFASPRNPCDATAQATRNPQSVREAAQALLADDRYAALVLPWGRSQSADLLPTLAELGRQYKKPICVVWMSQMPNIECMSMVERNPALALFSSLDACFTALAGWLRS